MSDQGQSGAFGMTRVVTANIVMKPAIHADEFNERLQSGVLHGMELDTIAIPAPSLVGVEAVGSTTNVPRERERSR